MNNIYNYKQKKSLIGRISYMNVAPVYYSFDRANLLPEWLSMFSATPSTLNKMMSENRLDISPVSSFAYAVNQNDWLLLPDLSISCFGNVMSVLFVSKYPFDKLCNKKIYLTDESATSSALLKLIFSIKNIKAQFYVKKINTDVDIDASAMLVIGDNAFKGKLNDRFEYVYDLGKIWKDLTGLPFVFALWAVHRKFAETKPEFVSAIIDYFKFSKKQGQININKVIKQASKKLGLSVKTTTTYFNNLNYDLNDNHIKGLESFFLDCMKKILLINQ